MILNYIEGCTAYNLTIDGVEASELPPYEIADVIRHLVGRCKDKGILKEMLERLIEYDRRVFATSATVTSAVTTSITTHWKFKRLWD